MANRKDILESVIQLFVTCPETRDMMKNELKNHESQTDIPPHTIHELTPIWIVHKKGKYKLYLGDNREMEIEIKTYQAKTLYIFYLLCPYEVANHELEKYMDILLLIYKEIHGPQKEESYWRANEFIGSFFKNKSAICDATHKVRKAFLSIIKDEQLCQYYLVKGKRNGGRKIALSKEKIHIKNSKMLEKVREELSKRKVKTT